MNIIICQLLNKKIEHKYDPINLFLYLWFENEESIDTTTKSDKEESVDLFDMPPLQVMMKN